MVLVVIDVPRKNMYRVCWNVRGEDMCALETIRQELMDVGIQVLSEESTSFYPYDPRGWGSVTTLVAAPQKAIGNIQEFLSLERGLARLLSVRVVLSFHDTSMQFSLLARVDAARNEDDSLFTRHRKLVCLCLYSRTWPKMPTAHRHSVPCSCMDDPHGLL